MSLYLAIPLIAIVFCLALLALLVLRGRQHIARKPFAIFLICMALWGIFIFLMRFSASLSQAAFWEMFVFGCILSDSVAFFWFTVSFTSSRINRSIFYSIIAIYLAFLGLLPTHLIFRGMQTMWYGKAPVIGPLFPLFVVFSYALIVFGMMLLLRNSHLSRSNDERTRNQYIVAGIVIMLVGATTDYLPAVGLRIYPLGIIGNIIFCVVATIAMLRYGLLEMRVVLRKGAAYSLISILIFGIFGSVILLITTTLQNTINPLSLAITITAVFLIAAIFQPLLAKLQHMVDRWFFRQRYDSLQALKKFAQNKEGDLDLKQLSASLVTTVANGMQSQGVYLLLPSPYTGDYVTYASSGISSIHAISFAAGSPLAITMKYQDSLIDSNDMDTIPALNNSSENDRKVLTENKIELLMPLKKESRLVGMLLLGRKLSGEPYLNEDEQLLRAVAADVAARIDNARQYNNIQKEHRELQKTMEGVISSVSAVVESRDPYTAGHQRRVAELARAIAGEMGLSEWRQKGIHIIGLLHDVGKMAIPAEILSKPGKISQYEFNIIKNHSRIGFEILEKVDFPWPVAKAILQHHERLNGSGYPDGLTTADIILEAKIIGVSDVVEAISSHRPYRPALGLEAALQEVKQQSGILYDREVVEACLRLLTKGDFAFEKIMSTAENRSQITVSARS